MALKHYDITIGAAATPLTSTTATRRMITEATIHNTSGNSAIFIGDSTVTASSYGHTLASSEEMTLGGSGVVGTDELYIAGTQDDVVHVLVVTY